MSIPAVGTIQPPKQELGFLLWAGTGADHLPPFSAEVIARAERDGTRAKTRFRLSPKRTSPFKSVRASVQSTAGSRGVSISLSNTG